MPKPTTWAEGTPWCSRFLEYLATSMELEKHAELVDGIRQEIARLSAIEDGDPTEEGENDD